MQCKFHLFIRFIQIKYDFSFHSKRDSMHVTTGSLLKYRIVMSFYSVNSSGPFWALQSYGFTYINIQICSLFRVHIVHRSIYKQVVKKMWYSISAFYDTFSSHPVSQFREKMFVCASCLKDGMQIFS